MAYEVFVSYSTNDLHIVNHLRALLADASIDVCIAEYSALPGTALHQSIIRAIEACDLFILLWSRHSKASDLVPQEIGIATHAKKIIMPIVLQPNLNLPGFIQNLEYLPAYQNPVNALNWVRVNVFERARAKQQQDGLIWLGLGAGVLWLLTRGDD
jgi:hypothetical protein